MREIILDTNAMIALSDSKHVLFHIVEGAVKSGAQASTCSIAWHEYVRGPLLDKDRARALRIIENRIHSFGRKDAELAAKLFNQTGRRRGSTADCLIAAVAIRIQAECLTWNLEDFRLFVPHGLRLIEEGVKRNGAASFPR
jgi:predicted nucleic acid-binding protein